MVGQARLEDAPEPRHQLVLAPQVRRALERLEQGRLDKIFGVRPAADPQRQAAHQRGPATGDGGQALSHLRSAHLARRSWRRHYFSSDASASGPAVTVTPSDSWGEPAR